MAIDAGLRILPVVLDGSLGIHRAGDKNVNKHQTVNVMIRPPIDAPGFGRTRSDELMEAVRSTIVEGLARSRAI
jgi:1-acyl-sn-glycerol-3-phosphate acyltransferase